jgi:hypothetical protein
VAKPPTDRVVAALLERHGQTYAQELGIDVAKGTPRPCSGCWSPPSCSAPGSAPARPARPPAPSLRRAGRPPRSSPPPPGSSGVRLLNRHGYARYDERTASMLGDACQLLLDCYRGDLRRLRAEAGQDPRQERRLLKQVKGLGEVGVDIFFREAQVAGQELFPFLSLNQRQPARSSARPSGVAAGGICRRRARSVSSS